MKYIVSYRVAADVCHWCDLDWLQTLVIAIGIAIGNGPLFKNKGIKCQNFKKIKALASIGKPRQKNQDGSAAHRGITAEKTVYNELKLAVLKYRLINERHLLFDQKYNAPVICLK